MDVTAMESFIATAGICVVIRTASLCPAVTGQATAKSSVAAKTNFLAQFVGPRSGALLAALAECGSRAKLVNVADTAPRLHLHVLSLGPNRPALRGPYRLRSSSVPGRNLMPGRVVTSVARNVEPRVERCSEWLAVEVVVFKKHHTNLRFV